MASPQTSASASAASAKIRKPQSAGVKLYLALYNMVQFFGWGYGLVLALQFLATSEKDSNFRLLWEHCSTVIATFQTIQLIEVVHAAVRFVPSSPIQTFIQILSRLVLVWGILVPIPEARYSLGVPMLLIAWSIAECTRYLYYGFHIYESAPFFSTWLRYSLFIVLYPMGVTGELLTTYAALATISKAKLWSIELPNIFNVSFYYDYLLVLFMLSYIHLVLSNGDLIGPRWTILWCRFIKPIALKDSSGEERQFSSGFQVLQSVDHVGNDLIYPVSSPKSLLDKDDFNTYNSDQIANFVKIWSKILIFVVTGNFSRHPWFDTSSLHGFCNQAAASLPSLCEQYSNLVGANREILALKKKYPNEVDPEAFSAEAEECIKKQPQLFLLRSKININRDSMFRHSDLVNYKRAGRT